MSVLTNSASQAQQAFAAKPLASKLRDAVGMRGLATQVFIENVVNNGML